MFDFANLDVYLPGILLAYSVILVGVLSPGPTVLAVIGTSMEKGRRPGVYLASGVICGSAFWGTVSALGISAILVTYAHVLVAIKIIGGLYLIWLAWKSLRSAIHPQIGEVALKSETGTPFEMWRTGLLLHLTNPKAIIAWIATIALGVTPDAPVWVSFAIVLGGIVFSFTGNMGYALIFSTKHMSSLYLKAKRPIAFIFSAFFGFAGLKLLTSRIE